MNYPPIQLGDTTFRLFVQTVNSSRVATAADSDAVTYGIYKESSTTPLLTGSFGTTVVNSKTGFYQTAALSITAGNGFASGGRYVVRIEYAITSTFAILQTFCVT